MIDALSDGSEWLPASAAWLLAPIPPLSPAAPDTTHLPSLASQVLTEEQFDGASLCDATLDDLLEIGVSLSDSEKILVYLSRQQPVPSR